MNTPSHAECARLRDQLAEWAIEGRPMAGLHEAERAHLARCQACARFAEGIKALPGAAVGETLYTPALRTRTLARLPERSQRSLILWLVPGAMALSLAASLLIPTLLFLPLFQSLSSHRWLAMGASALAAYTIGMAVAGLTLALLRPRESKEEVHA